MKFSGKDLSEKCRIGGMGENTDSTVSVSTICALK